MAQNKLPSLQFYPGDWKKDPGIRALNYEERGIWLELLMFMHESSERGVLLLNGKPMPMERLAQAMGLDNQKLTTAITTYLELGVASKRASDGAIYSRRMVRDEEIRQIRIRAGSRGGNPILLNQKSTTGDNQIPTPSSSSSSSSSSSDNNITPISVNELNGTSHKKPKAPIPKFNPEGKKKFEDWVFLSEEQIQRVQGYYKSKGLEPEELWEAIRELDRWFSENPKMRAKRTDDAKALMGWPLDNAIKRKQNLLALERQKSYTRK